MTTDGRPTEDYDKLQDHSDEIVSLLKSTLERTSITVLDIGVGTGKLSKLLSQSINKYYATEPNILFHERFRLLNPGVELYPYSFTEISKINKKFDVIMGVQSFQYVHPSEIDHVIEILLDTLDTGGVIILVGLIDIDAYDFKRVGSKTLPRLALAFRRTLRSLLSKPPEKIGYYNQIQALINYALKKELVMQVQKNAFYDYRLNVCIKKND